MTEVRSRLKAARDVIVELGVDCLLVSGEHDRRYLSGFTGSAGYLLVTASDAVLVTDFRYVEQAKNQAPEYELHQAAGRAEWLAQVLAGVDGRSIAFDPEQMTVSTLNGLSKQLESLPAPDYRMVPAPGMVSGLRLVKDPGEIELLERAVAIADAAFDEVEPRILPGVKESEVAWLLERTMREMGAEALSFDIIVGSGENGALPHHRAGERSICDGEPVVVDMGCIYEGYCSDLTRTVFVGEPDQRFRDVYNTVLRAQLRAERDVRVGMGGGEADALARDVIAEADLAVLFGHSLGHGVGLQVHERPWIATGSEDVLADGMVLTIEPGIYIPGWGGVRIEDMVVLEGGRARVLSAATKRDY